MLNNTNKSLDFYLLLLYLCPRMQSYKEVKKRGREGFQRAGKRADHVAKDSSVLESVPTTSRKIPACWKACRPRREGFQHAGKRAGHVAKDSSVLESVPTTSRKIPACWKACRLRRERFQHAGKYFEYKFKLYI